MLIVYISYNFFNYIFKAYHSIGTPYSSQPWQVLFFYQVHLKLIFKCSCFRHKPCFNERLINHFFRDPFIELFFNNLSKFLHVKVQLYFHYVFPYRHSCERTFNDLIYYFFWIAIYIYHVYFASVHHNIFNAYFS